MTREAAAAGRRISGRRALGAVASALVLAALGWTLVDGWSAVTAYDWDLRPAWLVGAFAALALGYALAAEAYARVVVELHPDAGGSQATLRRHWAISLLGRYVPGNVLMVAGRLELGRDAGVPRRVSLTASAYEQILMLGASALGGLGFLAIYGDLERGAIVWIVGAIPVFTVILHPVILRRMSAWLLRRAGREPLATVLTGRQALGLFLLYVVVQGTVSVGAWMIVRGVAGPEAGSVWFVALAFELAFSVAMLAFIFPSGLGVRDGVLALALAQRLPSEVAVAVAVLVRLGITLFELAYVAVVAAAARRRR